MAATGGEMMRKGYLGSRGPIDFWQGWLTIDAVVLEELKDPDRWLRGSSLDSLFRFMQAAMDKARTIDCGWEGDIREGPYVIGLPPPEGDYDVFYAVAWKQDNNGDTFVASPFLMTWMEPANGWHEFTW